ncbi:hypothetical protein [Vagococcus penaei]|uniref:hypothetical protein n=1 Tax=Vagococcus penaei TaxID=633807 RepID=UPI0011D03F53|nr:hypothetical protein [Vagococcus penaei]
MIEVLFLKQLTIVLAEEQSFNDLTKRVELADLPRIKIDTYQIGLPIQMTIILSIPSNALSSDENQYEYQLPN